MTCRSLSNLSDKKLLSGLRELVKKEKQTTLAILLHLAEVDRRELYLEYGFSSLYDYCVGALNYSRSAAGRRIATARCIRRSPEIYDLLDSGEVNLTTIGLVAPILDDENKKLLLREIRGKTQRQVETIVAAYRPPVAYRDRVKPVRVAVPDVGQNAKNRRNSLIFNSRHGSNSSSVSAGRAATHEAIPAGSARGTESKNTPIPPAHHIERRLLIQFLASEDFMAKLDEVKSLLSNKMPAGTFEDVFEVLMDEFLERHSPTKRQHRRENRKDRSITSRNTSSTSGAKSPAKEPPKNTPGATKPQRSRHVPAVLRGNVFARDNARCTYVGKNGKRCGSAHGLQIDHIKPFARGGLTTLSNLRLLCGKHNRLEAKRVLGADVMNRYDRRE